MFDPLEKLKEYVRHPSVSADPQFKQGMVGAQQFVSGLMKEIGFAVEVVPTTLHPVILAKREGDPKWPHVIIYGHYDVQPPDPLDKWNTSPFEPTVRVLPIVAVTFAPPESSRQKQRMSEATL